VSPRKSSTSSGRAPTRRPRYLGLVAAGDGPRTTSVRDWESVLRGGLVAANLERVRFRVVRSTAARAIVEVEHLDAVAARNAWNSTLPEASGAIPLRTARTWGTLRGAKAWLAAEGDRRPGHHPQ
jgi:hypothetical protein